MNKNGQLNAKMYESTKLHINSYKVHRRKGLYKKIQKNTNKPSTLAIDKKLTIQFNPNSS